MSRVRSLQTLLGLSPCVPGQSTRDSDVSVIFNGGLKCVARNKKQSKLEVVRQLFNGKRHRVARGKKTNFPNKERQERICACPL